MSSVGTAQYTAVLIGCGRMGAQDSSRLKGVLPTGWLPLSHAECMRSHPQIRLVGVCDPDADRLNQAGNAYDVQARFIDYREMLTSLKPNLVSVATRTGERPEIIELALSQGVRGLHVEKPLARSLGETRRVLGLLQEYNAFLTYGTTRRFMPIYRKAKVLLEQGRIGELQEVVIEHGHTNLLWSHPHSVDLLLYFVGTTQVRDVQASCTFQDNQSSLSLVEEDPLVDNALVRFADGVRGLITGASGMNTRLCGTQGHIVISGDGARLDVWAKAEEGALNFLHQETHEPPSEFSGTQQAFVDLVTALETERHTGISPAEIECAQAILFAVPYSSLLDGRRVTLDEVPENFTVMGKTGAFYA